MAKPFLIKLAKKGRLAAPLIGTPVTITADPIIASPSPRQLPRLIGQLQGKGRFRRLGISQSAVSWTSTKFQYIDTVAFTETLNAPTVGAQLVAIPLLSETETLNAPTLKSKAQVPLLSFTEILNAPTVGAQLVAIPLLSETETLNAPTVGAQLVAIPLLSETETLNAPTLKSKAQVPLLSETETLNAPTLTYRAQVPLLSETETLLAPTVGAQLVAIPLLLYVETLPMFTLPNGWQPEAPLPPIPHGRFPIRTTSRLFRSRRKLSQSSTRLHR